MAKRHVPPTAYALGDFFAIRTNAGIQGGQGIFAPGMLRRTGAVLALKIIDLKRCNTVAAGFTTLQAEAVRLGALAQAQSEAAIGMSLTHAFIVPTLGSFVHLDQHMYIVMKLLNGSVSVDGVMEDTWRIECTRRLFPQIAFAVEYMHAKGIAHLDIKPDNVLVGHGEHSALCDFGVSHRCTAVGGELHPTGAREELRSIGDDL